MARAWGVQIAALEASVQAAPKSGARHFVWDKAQKHLYLVNELDASLYLHDWAAVHGPLREG